MTAKRKRITLGVLLAAIVYTVGWLVLANGTEIHLKRQMLAERAHGVIITSSGHRKSGFPFALRVSLSDFTLTGPSGVSVTTPRLVLGVGLFDVRHVSVGAHLGTLVTLPAANTRPPVKAAIADVVGDIHFGSQGPGAASVTLGAVTVEGLVPAETPLTAESIAVKLEKPDTEPADHTMPGAHVTVDIATLFLPGPEIPALGNTVDRLTVDALLMGSIPALDEPSLAAWRDEGGTIEIRDLSAHWNRLSFAMDGTLALDRAFQPEGSFNARIQGYDQAVDALAAAHAIKDQYAGMIKMGLSVIARPAGGDDVPTLAVPLTIQERKLYLSRFRIMALPEAHLF